MDEWLLFFRLCVVVIVLCFCFYLLLRCFGVFVVALFCFVLDCVVWLVVWIWCDVLLFIVLVSFVVVNTLSVSIVITRVGWRCCVVL